MKRIVILVAIVFLCIAAQNRMNYSLVSEDSGHIALGLALRKLGVSGTFMQTAAHPDDEHNGLYALYTRGMGLRSISAQITRGDGGQNEIGPELFRDIAVLRTSELLSAHRIDGAEEVFTRAIDYGYSFDPQEVIGKWGRAEIVGDIVRLIRMYRPDVFLTMNIQGRGGDRAHEATTVLSREAYFAAGDPTKYPEQIKEGLRPWQPKKLYFTGGFTGGGGGTPATGKMTAVNTGVYDKLLGRTYSEIGTDARSNHKCQGTNGLPPITGVANQGRGGGGGGPRSYQLVDSSIAGQKEKDETSMFDGVDTSLGSLAQYAGANPPAALVSALNSIAGDAKQAQSAFDAGNDAATVAPVEAGLIAIRALLAQLPSMQLSDAAKYEINFRLQLKERDFADAVLAAHNMTFEALSNDGLVVRGQQVGLTMVAVNRGATPVTVGIEVVGLGSANCPPTPAALTGGVVTCTSNPQVPIDAKLTTPSFSDHYWKTPANPAINIFEPDVPFGAPFRPTPFRALFHVKTGTVEVTKELPIQFRYVKDIYTGDKRMELNVVPALSVRVSPPLIVLPVGSQSREVFVTVTNGKKGAAESVVTLNLPAGWKAQPASVPINFQHEDESLSARFQIVAPTGVKPGEFTLRAVATADGQTFSNGYQEIEYPHVQRRQVIKPAEASLKVVDVKVTSNLKVGYINGVGDQVPQAIEQLGASLTFIEQDELAWGDLSKYKVIVTGVRAYERRADLRAYNSRLLEYAANGGTVIVQYNKFEFNQGQYGPFAAQVSANRVSDETVPVKVLVPEHPVFNFPNKIGPETWSNWVQERGLYYLGQKDPKYLDMVSMVDSFPDNPGEKLGSLVEGQVGKGHWIYLGLALWRQLPAGTDGVYRLLSNLLNR